MGCNILDYDSMDAMRIIQEWDHFKEVLKPYSDPLLSISIEVPLSVPIFGIGWVRLSCCACSPLYVYLWSSSIFLEVVSFPMPQFLLPLLCLLGGD